MKEEFASPTPIHSDRNGADNNLLKGKAQHIV